MLYVPFANVTSGVATPAKDSLYAPEVVSGPADAGPKVFGLYIATLRGTEPLLLGSKS
jgi:hypothetical protein